MYFILFLTSKESRDGFISHRLRRSSAFFEGVSILLLQSYRVRKPMWRDLRVAPHGPRAARKSLQPSLRGRDGERIWARPGDAATGPAAGPCRGV